MNQKIFKLSFLLVLLALSVTAQTKEITGLVTSFNRYAMKGVQVKAKKSKKLVKTDSLGYFKILCHPKDVLIVTADGFMAERFSVKDRSHIECNMILLSNSSARKSAVKKGYMTLEEMDYAVENLMDENNDFSKFQDICELLQNKYPMAKCEEVNGANRVFLSSRPQSINAGQWALCVVDGIPTDDISSISPMQVSTIEVLAPEDAAEWGVRAGNGVLVIKLKSK